MIGCNPAREGEGGRRGGRVRFRSIGISLALGTRGSLRRGLMMMMIVGSINLINLISLIIDDVIPWEPNPRCLSHELSINLSIDVRGEAP